VSREQARYAGGLAGCVVLGLGTVVGLYLAAPPRAAGEQGPQRWLLLGGACVVPAALFYGWVLGAWVAGKVVR
jgi:hypothetical protein